MANNKVSNFLMVSLWMLFLALLLIIGLIFARHGEYDSNLLLGWLCTAALISLFLFLLGQFTKHGARTFFIDGNRNKYSLSRIQMVCWTVIILSAHLTLTLTRIVHSNDKEGHTLYASGLPSDKSENYASAVGIPKEVLALLGISIGAALITPVINNTKGRKTNRKDDTVKKSKKLDNSSVVPLYENVLKMNVGSNRNVSNIGAIQINKKIENAKLIDIFMGEEVKNYKLLDISKIQQFVITLAVMVSYMYIVFRSFSRVELPIHEMNILPNIPKDLLYLVIASHTYYIGNKVITQSTPASGENLQSSQFTDGQIA